MQITAFAGGVGGAKLADGLYRTLAPESLSIIGNTGDDFVLWGLAISPDLDTVLYTLSGLANPATGWGIAGDTWTTLESLKRLGVDTWFRIGDQDFATHLRRTELLAAGWTLTAITAAFMEALGVKARLLPMCDDAVPTLVDTPAGRLQFQDYFVRRQHRDDVLGVEFSGVAEARPSQAALAALGSADLIVVTPSNPIVSIGPILAVPGMREALAAARAPRVAISPLIGGAAVKGPADKMLHGLGHEPTSLGVARLYVGLIDGLVIDRVDADLASAIEELGLRTLVTDTLMRETGDRERLAREVVAWGQTFQGREP